MSSSLTIVKRLFKQTNIENCAVSLFADPHKVIFFCFVQLVLRCFVELVLLRFRASAPLKTTWGGCCRCSCPYHSFVNLLPNSFPPNTITHFFTFHHLQSYCNWDGIKKPFLAKDFHVCPSHISVIEFFFQFSNSTYFFLTSLSLTISFRIEPLFNAIKPHPILSIFGKV